MPLRCIGLASLVFAAAPVCADACLDALNQFAYPEAQTIAEARLASQPGDAGARLCLARSQYERGDFPAALTTLDQTHRLPLTPLLRAQTGNWQAVTLRKLGQPGLAWQHQQTALHLARQLKDPGTLATALHNSATLLSDAGQKTAALAQYRESVSFNPDLAERSASLNNMALIEEELGHPANAEPLFQAAIALNRQHGHFHHLGKHLMNLGNHYRQRGHHDEAAALLEEGAILVAQAGDRYWIAVGHRLSAWLARDRGMKQEAAAQFREAISAYQASGALLDAKAASAELAALGGVGTDQD
jgi:tetratricopeptide (TPR) repeat protein